ncbi:MAG: hypothetical protein KJN63_07810 [Acidimicrobiia bacterium]|nr:hypothetical protein [Acidimicrobiia bacterium]
MQPNHRNLLIAAVLALVASACTTAGNQLEGSSPDSLPFDPVDRQDQPVTETTASTPESSTSLFDPAIAGPQFDVSAEGLTLAVSGENGIWWFDAKGEAQLVVEPAVAGDYDGSGGLVFQRSEDAPIVRRTADAIETEIVSPAVDENLKLIGVAQTGVGREAVYLRLGDGSVTLERTTLDGATQTTLADLDRDGVAPQRLSISNGYVSGVYLEGSGAGWVTLSLTTGQKLFGTTGGSLGNCSRPAPGCALAVTIDPSRTRVYQVAAGDDTEEWELVVNDASNFAALSSVSLQRPPKGWHPTRIDVAGTKVVISRSATSDGTADLPALVIEPETGAITQLDRPGIAVVVAG